MNVIAVAAHPSTTQPTSLQHNPSGNRRCHVILSRGTSLKIATLCSRVIFFISTPSLGDVLIAQPQINPVFQIVCGVCRDEVRVLGKSCQLACDVGSRSCSKTDFTPDYWSRFDLSTAGNQANL